MSEESIQKFKRYQHLLPSSSGAEVSRPSWPLLGEKEQKDRAVASFLGLALGDAFGSALASKIDPTFPNPAEWTDATAMALCLAESLLAEEGLDQYDFMQRLQRWFRVGENTIQGKCISIGATTQKAIESFEKDDEPSAGVLDENSAGNASLLRLLPVVLYSQNVNEACFLAAKQSRTTHATIECLHACELFAAQLFDVISGANKDQALGPRRMQLVPNVLAINGGEWKEKTRQEVKAGPYVIHTLEAALWCVWNTSHFEEALRLAASLSKESSSHLTSVTGQLAGALYGTGSLPKDWLAGLLWREKIESLAVALVARKIKL